MVVPSVMVEESDDTCPPRQVDYLVRRRVSRVDQSVEYLARWVGLDATHDSWESAPSLSPETIRVYIVWYAAKLKANNLKCLTISDADCDDDDDEEASAGPISDDELDDEFDEEQRQEEQRQEEFDEESQQESSSFELNVTMFSGRKAYDCYLVRVTPESAETKDPLSYDCNTVNDLLTYVQGRLPAAFNPGHTLVLTFQGKEYPDDTQLHNIPDIGKDGAPFICCRAAKGAPQAPPQSPMPTTTASNVTAAAAVVVASAAAAAAAAAAAVAVAAAAATSAAAASATSSTGTPSPSRRHDSPGRGHRRRFDIINQLAATCAGDSIADVTFLLPERHRLRTHGFIKVATTGDSEGDEEVSSKLCPIYVFPSYNTDPETSKHVVITISGYPDIGVEPDSLFLLVDAIYDKDIQKHRVRGVNVTTQDDLWARRQRHVGHDNRKIPRTTKVKWVDFIALDDLPRKIAEVLEIDLASGLLWPIDSLEQRARLVGPADPIPVDCPVGRKRQYEAVARAQASENKRLSKQTKCELAYGLHVSTGMTRVSEEGFGN